jgi:DNA-binding NarL/FixJ family response regulator
MPLNEDVEAPAGPATPRSGGRRAIQRSIAPRHLSDDTPARQRVMLAEYLRLLAWWMGRPPAPGLSPRLDQTLRGLLAGDGEKQVAERLGVSVHTAHAYVKDLYKRLGVSSRGELMAKYLPTLPNQGHHPGERDEIVRE